MHVIYTCIYHHATGGVPTMTSQGGASLRVNGPRDKICNFKVVLLGKCVCVSSGMGSCVFFSVCTHFIYR